MLHCTNLEQSYIPITKPTETLTQGEPRFLKEVQPNSAESNRVHMA